MQKQNDLCWVINHDTQVVIYTDGCRWCAKTWPLEYYELWIGMTRLYRLWLVDVAVHHDNTILSLFHAAYCYHSVGPPVLHGALSEVGGEGAQVSDQSTGHNDLWYQRNSKAWFLLLKWLPNCLDASYYFGKSLFLFVLPACKYI